MRPPVARAGRPFTCLRCLVQTSLGRPAASAYYRLRKPQTPPSALYHSTRTLGKDASTAPEHQQPAAARQPTTAPKAVPDIKHIRQNPDLYARNCRDRNYPAAATYPDRIIELFAQWQA